MPDVPALPDSMPGTPQGWTRTRSQFRISDIVPPCWNVNCPAEGRERIPSLTVARRDDGSPRALNASFVTSLERTRTGIAVVKTAITATAYPMCVSCISFVPHLLQAELTGLRCNQAFGPAVSGERDRIVGVDRQCDRVAAGVELW